MKFEMEHEETNFTRAFGNNPTVRVLDLLITGRGLDYSISDMVEGAEVGWTTIHEILPRLMETGLVKHTRCIGRAKLYQMNKENLIAEQLIKMYDMMLMQNTGENWEEKIVN